MLLRLFLLFTVVPLLELMLLIRVGGLIGLGPTLLLVVATGAAGAWLARQEGLRSWMAVQGELVAGRLPGEELVHGLLVLVAGIVLVTPGVLTDLLGLALLVRPVRRALISRIRDRFTKSLEAGGAPGVGGPAFNFYWMGGGPAGPSPSSTGDESSRSASQDEAGDGRGGELPGEGPPRRPRIVEM
jgi:UPF0716 protein FxsA